jgi:hypothetical protein
VTVYTAIFGNVDDLKEPFKVSDGWNYVCYTDQNLQSNVWEIRQVPVMEFGPVKTARWYKINFHKHIDDAFSMWIDGTFFINCDLNEWWEERFTAPFTTIFHPFDDCIYVDARACLSQGKGDPKKIEQQIELYSHLGIKKHSGLISSGILMREKIMPVKKICTTWWQQVEAWSERDQIAFGYAQHKHPGVHRSIKWDYTKEKEFIHIPHKYKSWSKEKFYSISKLYGPKGN